MWSTAREIAAGDLVIAWLTRDLIQPLLITPGKDLNSKYGHYKHSDLIGVPYGSKIRSRNGKGFIHLLRPTPELWTLALPHRTQILYLADIAFVVSWLDLRPGSKVIEAGTGSGSFSHSVARTIGPTGHLWSYEFHEARASKAREEFARHGMDDVVTLTHRNVCKDGFTVEDTVDAVFLDLPAPWEAVEHAKRALRKDRSTRICCFSPCMEQVLRTVSALNDAGFAEITMYETLVRPHQVEAAPALTPIGVVGARLQRSEARREEKRQRQIANARRAAKRKAEEDDDEDKDGDNDGEGKGHGKRVRADGPVAESGATDEGVVCKEEGEGVVCKEEEEERAMVAGAEEAEDAMETDEVVLASDAAMPAPGRSSTVVDEATMVQQKITLSKAFPEVRGHTSYLTFAVLLPAAVMNGHKVAAPAAGSDAGGVSERPSGATSAETTPPPPASAGEEAKTAGASQTDTTGTTLG